MHALFSPTHRCLTDNRSAGRIENAKVPSFFFFFYIETLSLPFVVGNDQFFEIDNGSGRFYSSTDFRLRSVLPLDGILGW